MVGRLWPSEFEVRPAAAEELPEALALVLRHVAPSARAAMLDAVKATPTDGFGGTAGLSVAIHAGRVACACWTQPAPGNAAVLWPPEWVDAPPAAGPEVELALITQSLSAADTAGVAFSQLLFEAPEDPRRTVAEGAGFVRVATLDYLGRSLPAAEAESLPEAATLSFRPVRASERDRLKELLSATYKDTLDCPALDGWRDLDDVLDSYETIGDPGARVWQIALEGDGAVGVLLMARHGATDQAELVYMGLRPEARGRGRGAALVGEAIRVAHGMGAETLVAAVDRANTPAKRLYERAGFAAWAERHVYVRRNGDAPLPRRE